MSIEGYRVSMCHLLFTPEKTRRPSISKMQCLNSARHASVILSLEDDPELMGRLREESVCIELCPISNHQTSQFAEPSDRFARKYPLRRCLDNDLLVTIATDNPTVSHTDIIKEYYQASYCYGEQGLSIWNALRLMRMGINSAFLPLSERRSLLELAEQHCFDLLIRPDIVRVLRRLATANKAATS